MLHIDEDDLLDTIDTQLETIGTIFSSATELSHLFSIDKNIILDMIISGASPEEIKLHRCDQKEDSHTIVDVFFVLQLQNMKIQLSLFITQLFCYIDEADTIFESLYHIL